MNKDYLRNGDVIELKPGMKVYANIPEKFIYNNRGYSDKTTNTDVKIGDILEKKMDRNKVVNEIVNDIVKAFESRSGVVLRYDTVFDFVINRISDCQDEQFDTSVLAGEYVVIDTLMTGGGYGHGEHDVYPDGYRITCKKLSNGNYDKNGDEVRFYQSGCFTAMITPDKISAIRKLEMRYE